MSGDTPEVAPVAEAAGDFVETVIDDAVSSVAEAEAEARETAEQIIEGAAEMQRVQEVQRLREDVSTWRNEQETRLSELTQAVAVLSAATAEMSGLLQGLSSQPPQNPPPPANEENADGDQSTNSNEPPQAEMPQPPPPSNDAPNESPVDRGRPRRRWI